MGLYVDLESWKGKKVYEQSCMYTRNWVFFFNSKLSSGELNRREGGRGRERERAFFFYFVCFVLS